MGGCVGFSTAAPIEFKFKVQHEPTSGSLAIGLSA